jgi:hypothetical protein
MSAAKIVGPPSKRLMSSIAALLLFAAIAIPAGLVAIRHWRSALFGVLVLLVFEGALRKWAFPWAHAQIYLLKDAILLASYVGFLLDNRRGDVPLRGVGTIKVILSVAFVFGCIEVFNPNSPSVLVGLVGLKAYFLYAPIAFILPYAFKSRDHMLQMIKRYLLIAIPVALLGFVQIAAGRDSFLNVYVGGSDDTNSAVTFGLGYDLVRTTGTFSFISGYTTYLSFIAFLALGYNMAQGWRIRNNFAPLAALAVVVGAMFTTGSRGPVYTLVATAPLILSWAVMSRILAPVIAVRLCVVLPIIAAVALAVSPGAFDAFVQRATMSSDSTADRLLSPAIQVIDMLAGAPALGLGIGTTHPAAITVMGTTSAWWLGSLLREEEMARVTVELGLIGLLLMLSLRIFVAVFAISCVRRFKDPGHRAFAIVLAIYLTLAIISAIILNATAAVYYWGALGLVLAMQRFEQFPARVKVSAASISSGSKFKRA